MKFRKWLQGPVPWLLLVALVPAGIATAAKATVHVEVYAPPLLRPDIPSTLQAQADNCTAKTWVWTAAGCQLTPRRNPEAPEAGLVDVQCPRTVRSVTVTAEARGGGCGKAKGSVSVPISQAGDVPDCPEGDDLATGAVISTSPGGWYYRPGTQSTGRLKLQVVVYGCKERG